MRVKWGKGRKGGGCGLRRRREDERRKRGGEMGRLSVMWVFSGGVLRFFER